MAYAVASPLPGRNFSLLFMFSILLWILCYLKYLIPLISGLFNGFKIKEIRSTPYRLRFLPFFVVLQVEYVKYAPITAGADKHSHRTFKCCKFIWSVELCNIMKFHVFVCLANIIRVCHYNTNSRSYCCKVLCRWQKKPSFVKPNVHEGCSRNLTSFLLEFLLDHSGNQG